MRFLVLSIFLIGASWKLLDAQSTCDGTVPEMHRFFYLRPTTFVIGSGNTTMVTREECSEICKTNDNCAYAYYYLFTCYQGNYFQTTMTRYVPGELLVKFFRDETSCNMTFPKLMSDSVKFPLKSREGASFSYSLADDVVTFNYNADAPKFGKKRR